MGNARRMSESPRHNHRCPRNAASLRRLRIHGCNGEAWRRDTKHSASALSQLCLGSERGVLGSPHGPSRPGQYRLAVSGAPEAGGKCCLGAKTTKVLAVE